jgi:DNA-binding CsgD family transcriptional regulator
MAEALAYGEAGFELAERIGHAQWTVYAQWVLGRIHADMLNIREARARLELAIDGSIKVGSRLWRLMAVAALGFLLLDIGEIDGAAALLDPDVSEDRPPMTLGERQVRLSWIQLCTARGEPDRALLAIQRILDKSSRGGRRSLPWFAYAEAEALAAAGRFEDAVDAFNDAREGATAIGYRNLLWRIDLRCAEASMRAGLDATQFLARARDTTEHIARTIPLEAQRSEFLSATRGRFPVAEESAPNSAIAGGLSLREREVLQLVARGLTDAEVGERLFISRRTVGRHLQSIFNKVGATSRTAAVAFAFEHELVERVRRD